MNFVVRNSPSPGAMLSDSNHESILWYLEEAENLGNRRMKFQEFRKVVCDKHHTSQGNDRTVYPLLKNLGFLQYDAWMDTSHFFTSNGKAYVKLLKSIRDIEQKEDIEEDERKKVLEKLHAMMEKIVYRGVWIMLTEKPPKEVSYRGTVLHLLSYLLQFDSIDKMEFAYFLYGLQNEISLGELADTIHRYRIGQEMLEYTVDVYDKTVDGTQLRKRKKGSLTCYSYLMNLLQKAGIVYAPEENTKKFCLEEEKRKELQDMLEKAGVQHV